MGDKQRRSWPWRFTLQVGRFIYPAIARSSLGWLVRLPLVERIKYCIIYTPAWRVLAILDLLEAAEIRAWVGGGWGVDALLGRQTRRHSDIDLVISDDGPPYQQVARVLAHEGFRLVGTYHSPGILIPWCYVWRHDTGHKVEVLPVPLCERPFAPANVAEADGWQSFTKGTIDGRPVPCLSAELQLLLHTGYAQREIDNHDVALLRAYFDLPERMTTA